MDLILGASAIAAILAVAGAPPAWLYARFHAYHRAKGLDHGLDAQTIAQRVAGEVRAYAHLATWNLRRPLEEGWRAHPEPRGRPVLAIHGFTQNASNFVAIRRALEAAGRPTGAVSLGFPGRRVRGYAPALIEALERALERNPDGIDVVAHSMGGLVLRVVCSDRPDLARGLRTIATLATPHAGTAMARGIGSLWPEAFDLRRGAALHRDVPGLPALVPHATLTTLAGDYDVIVYPRATCHIDGVRSVDLPVGHAGLLVDARSVGAVVSAIIP